MCTIGGYIDNKTTTTFKNCDLINNTTFFTPVIIQGKYRYIAFQREGRPGIYAGINEYGLSIVAADTYTKKEYEEGPNTVDNIFMAYERTIANHKNIDDALPFLKGFYSTKITIPDMIILADRQKIVVIEFTPGMKFGIKECTNGHVARTNQFRILSGGKNRLEDPESFIRYDTVSKLQTTNEPTPLILNDHTNGPSQFSVCRHGKRGEFNTQASIILTTDDKTTEAKYIINNHPCNDVYSTVTLS